MRVQWHYTGVSMHGKMHSPPGRMTDMVLLQLRAAWQLDARTALVVCDPTSPNILQFRAGREVSQLLSRPFFVELQSRYGNLYYVREEVTDTHICSSITWVHIQV